MTLDERVSEHWSHYEYPLGNLYENVFKDGYILGAREQKEIDVENACDWLEDNAIKYIGKDGITAWRQVYKDFRKAMEGLCCGQDLYGRT